MNILGALNIALNQWKSYACEFGSRDLDDDHSIEGEQYRLCEKALTAANAEIPMIFRTS